MPLNNAPQLENPAIIPNTKKVNNELLLLIFKNPANPNLFKNKNIIIIITAGIHHHFELPFLREMSRSDKGFSMLK